MGYSVEELFKKGKEIKYLAIYEQNGLKHSFIDKIKPFVISTNERNLYIRTAIESQLVYRFLAMLEMTTEIEVPMKIIGR